MRPRVARSAAKKLNYNTRSKPQALPQTTHTHPQPITHTPHTMSRSLFLVAFVALVGELRGRLIRLHGPLRVHLAGLVRAPRARPAQLPAGIAVARARAAQRAPTMDRRLPAARRSTGPQDAQCT